MLSMENYDSVCDLSIIPGNLSKSIRRMDIKRGSSYLRTIDSLAHEQWTAHGKTPLIAAAVPDLSLGPVEGINTHSIGQARSSQHTQRNGMEVLLCDKISNRNLSSFQNKSLSVHSSREGVSDTKSNGYVHLRKVAGKVSVKSGDGHSSIRNGTGYGFVNKDGQSDYFNTWGSREWDQENKIVPEKQPRIIMPKQGVIMSRVAKDKVNRRFRTNTDFRSRNGTIRIIHSPKPLPLIEQMSTLSLVNNFDPESLKREQTYMMLKRIDQLLHPSRVFKGDTTSSEQEIHSTISSLTESMEVSNVYDNVNNRPIYSKRFPEKGLQKRLKTKECSNSQMQQPFPSLHHLIVKKLEHSELDYYLKCQQWVNKWFANSKGVH